MDRDLYLATRNSPSRSPTRIYQRCDRKPRSNNSRVSFKYSLDSRSDHFPFLDLEHGRSLLFPTGRKRSRGADDKMSEERTLSKTRRYVIVIPLLSIIGFSSLFAGSGGSPNVTGEAQIMEKGLTTTFTFTAGSLSKSQAITFPVAFSTAPNVSLTILSNPFSSGVRIGDVITMVAGGAVTSAWPAMPTLQTEIFGNTNNEMRTDDFVADKMRLTVNIVTPGSGSASLRTQLSFNPPGNWVDPCLVTGTADVNIGSAGLFSANCDLSSNSVTNNGPFMRIIGMNGNGVATPVFGIIAVTFLSSIGIVTNLNALSVSTTGFTLNALITAPAPFGGTYTIQWIAQECVKGGDVC